MRDSYEIFNNGQVTPGRLRALVRLVARLQSPSRREILEYLQPNVLTKNQEAANSVYSAAAKCGLITKSETSSDPVALDPSLHAMDFEDYDSYREVMQNRLLGQTDPDGDHYLLNLIAAWYAVSGDRALYDSKRDVETQFNAALFPRSDDVSIQEGRAINTTKLTSWLVWASFLGWGVSYKQMFLPNAQMRLTPLLRELRGQRHLFADFIQLTGERCPELDGGSLFEYSWQSAKPAEVRGQRVSLMISTALRVLNDVRAIDLIHQPDALDRWHLHPADGHRVQEVTHIEIIGA